MKYYKADDKKPLVTLTFHALADLIEKGGRESEIEATFDEDGIEIIDDLQEDNDYDDLEDKDDDDDLEDIEFDD